MRICLHCGAPIELEQGAWLVPRDAGGQWVGHVAFCMQAGSAGHAPRAGEFELDATGQYIPVIHAQEQQIMSAFGVRMDGGSAGHIWCFRHEMPIPWCPEHQGTISGSGAISGTGTLTWPPPAAKVTTVHGTIEVSEAEPIQGICDGCKTDSYVVDGLCTYCQRLAEQTRKTAEIDARRGAAVASRRKTGPYPYLRVLTALFLVASVTVAAIWPWMAGLLGIEVLAMAIALVSARP